MTTQKRNIVPIGIAAIITASSIAASTAQADIIEFDIVWNNIIGDGSPATGASAVGTMTLDTSLASGVYDWDNVLNPIVDLSITITDSVSSNGTYSLGASDIYLTNWDVTGPLDYDAELVAQGLINDFNHVGVNTTGFGPSTFITLGSRDVFELATITRSVPSPSALALLGLGGFVGARRRR